MQQEQIRKRLEEVGGDGKKPPSRGGLSGRGPGQKLGYDMAKEFNLETEGRLRYKILTNFVNAYKDKMFLSNSPGKAGTGDDDNVMTLEELKKKTQVEQSDIKLDFEQFMRIFSFEKNRPAGAASGENKDHQSFMSGVSHEAAAN